MSGTPVRPRTPAVLLSTPLNPEQLERAREYLQDHDIVRLLKSLTAVLVFRKPQNARMFLCDQLREIQARHPQPPFHMQALQFLFTDDVPEATEDPVETAMGEEKEEEEIEKDAQVGKDNDKEEEEEEAATASSRPDAGDSAAAPGEEPLEGEQGKGEKEEDEKPVAEGSVDGEYVMVSKDDAKSETEEPKTDKPMSFRAAALFSKILQDQEDEDLDDMEEEELEAVVSRLKSVLEEKAVEIQNKNQTIEILAPEVASDDEQDDGSDQEDDDDEQMEDESALLDAIRLAQSKLTEKEKVVQEKDANIHELMDNLDHTLSDVTSATSSYYPGSRPSSAGALGMVNA